MSTQPCTSHAARECTGSADPDIVNASICLPCAIQAAEERLSALYGLRNDRDLHQQRKKCKRCAKRFPASHLSLSNRCPACADAVNEFDARAMTADDIFPENRS